MEIFVSYSWINDQPDDKVLRLVETLRVNGYDAKCDVMLNTEETAIHFTKMISEQLNNSKKVIVVLSKKYKEKADSFKSGVGEEFQYIIEDIKEQKQKYILVTFENNRESVTPDFLRGRNIISLNMDEIISNELLHKLNGTKEYSFSPVSPTKTMPSNKEIKSERIENDIDMYDDCTQFFEWRMKGAFPGIRGIKVFDKPEECIERLSILLKQPLSSMKLPDPIWFFRGSSCLSISNFEIISSTKCIIGIDELEIEKIACYTSNQCVRDFVYIQTKAEKPTGVYKEINKEYINAVLEYENFCCEEYGLYNGVQITREEYDDGAAEINGKITGFIEKPKLRVRYHTPYNFVICAKNHPFNSTEGDKFTKIGLNDILNAKLSIEDFIDSSKEIPINKNMM